MRRTVLRSNQGLPPDQQIPRWTLYQLRHAFLTKKTEQFDENVAALLAGHSDPKMVRDIYDKSQERRIIRLKLEEDEQGENTKRPEKFCTTLQNIDVTELTKNIKNEASVCFTTARNLQNLKLGKFCS